MSGIHHEFTDSESASFLHGEAKENQGPGGFLGGIAARGRLWSPISRFLPYLLSAVIVILVMIILGSSKEIQEKSLLPSQSMFGKSTTSI
jgi:hypothetical protein